MSTATAVNIVLNDTRYEHLIVPDAPELLCGVWPHWSLFSQYNIKNLMKGMTSFGYDKFKI